MEVKPRKSHPETKNSDQGCSEGVQLRLKIHTSHMGKQKVLSIVEDMLN